MKSNSDSETGNPIPRLSIVIATRNRASYLAETLKNIVGDGGGRVEIVVVDGASSDDTERVVGELAGRHPEIRYFREQTNSGVDGDYDKGVAYARTEYCWLLSDDDLLVAGAVDTVLQALATSGQPDIVVANAGVWSADMSQQLSPRRLPFDETRTYGPGDAVRFFRECGDHLTFIGGAIVRRALWMGRARKPYFGTEFIHVGVIFQSPVTTAVAIGKPLVKIRYGVGNWTKRAFEVWVVKWPRLIWSFTWIPEADRKAVVEKEPWTDLVRMVLFRARGWYSFSDFRRHVFTGEGRLLKRFGLGALSLVPGRPLNRALVAFGNTRKERWAGTLYDLNRSPFGAQK